jgi:hypothetical protein
MQGPGFNLWYDTKRKELEEGIKGLLYPLTPDGCVLHFTKITKLSVVGQESRRSQVPVVHTCNPSCKGGRNQKGHGSKSALGK